ncbi:MAG TPA: hypothetical protein VHG92_06700 [Afifellaceae bacterium]|nr:hypothetical protein [Afifellaceae bacterium]
MTSNPLLVGIVALAIVNGIFSPFFVFTSRIIVLNLAPGLLFVGPVLVAFIASLVAATATLILAGIPAALFERATGRAETDTASYAVWLAAAALISLPALVQAASLMA